jgi:pyridoxamine 5'-phosphate oxidase
VDPRAAALFYWPAQGRQVRLAGPVVRRDASAAAADFLARSPASRGAALATRPGEPLASRAELVGALDAARRTAEGAPDLVLPEWRLYALVPLEVEFFAGDPGRAHARLRYRRDEVGAAWRHGLVWP